MKKLAFIFAAIIILAGCQMGNDLSGCVYCGFAYHANDKTIAGMHIDGYDDYYVFRFYDETNLERTTRKTSAYGEIIGETETGTYTYSHPNIEITYKDKYSGRNVTLKGEFLDKKNIPLRWS